MSSGLYGILNLTTGALFSTQTAIEVTGHNIANVNTQGYTRQEVLFEPNAPHHVYGVYIGRGVTIRTVRANENRYINYQIYRNSSLLGSMEAQARNISSLEEIFNESMSEGFSYSLNSFFQSLGDLASAPEGQPERTAVIGAARSLVTNFHLMDSRLTEIAAASNNEVKYLISGINQLAEEIADLNQKIMNIESSGQNANDFRSMRAQLMTELAEKIDFTSFEDDKGMVTIMVGNGMPLVENVSHGTLVGINNTDNNNYFDVYFEDGNGNQFDITSQIQGGSIHGVLNIRDSVIANLRSSIDDIAFTLVNSFNAQHQAGWTLNGTTGVDFFASLAGSEGAAAAIEIDPSVLNDVNNIAAGATNSAGDNNNALALSGLQDELLFNGGAWNFQDEYSSIVSEVGSESRRMINGYEHQLEITTQVINARESVAGVSMEEEMANLIRYQESYQACARLFNTVSELVEVLVSLH